jgi:hypothetical protein
MGSLRDLESRKKSRNDFDLEASALSGGQALMRVVCIGVILVRSHVRQDLL